MILLFLGQSQKFKDKSLSSLQKKLFNCAIFGKIRYVAYAINRAGKLICLLAWLHERVRAGVIDKPGGLDLSAHYAD